MGLADLFRSKPPKPKPDPQIRWFGKLPTYADYYRSRSDEEWSVEFNNWVLKGFEMYQQRRSADMQRHGRLPLAACVLRLPESGMTVFASIQDYGGDMRGRPFPICFYAGVPSEDWKGPTSSHIGAASRVIRDLLALRQEVPRFLNSPGRFETHFGDREVNLSGIDDQTEGDSWLEQARKIPLCDWMSGAQAGLEVQDPQVWFDLVEQWGEKIAGLESKKFEPTLRFPLAAGIGVEVQTAGWLRWLESRMDLKRRLLTLMVYGDTEQGVGHLVVVARELVAEDFLLLTPAANTLYCMDDLCGVKLDSAEGLNGRESSPAQGVYQPSGSWADFVEGVPATS
ncbi:MAG: DUF2094 domain-containing protein [Phycisphaerae bacterium]|nr:DUF2094 domain-containing protein [Phycisphaerae bacterium]